MASSLVGERELDVLVHDIQHVQNEHKRATAEAVRRKLRGRLSDLQERFESVLAEEVADEDVRVAWREHVRQHAPAPDEPHDLMPVVFRGRSEAGSEVVVRAARSGELGVEVDGALVQRARGLDLREAGGTCLLQPNGLGSFRETFDVPGDALDALRAWVEHASGEPPWQHLRALYAEGLCDEHFALTPRGRRALGAPARPASRTRPSRRAA